MSPANSFEDHVIDIKLTTEALTATPNLQDAQTSKGSEGQLDRVLLKALTGNGLKQESKDDQSSKIETQIGSSVSSASTSATSTLAAWTKLTEDLTRAQLIELFLADVDDLAKLQSRQKRMVAHKSGVTEVPQEQTTKDDDDDDDDDGKDDDDDDDDENYSNGEDDDNQDNDDDDDDKDDDDRSRRWRSGDLRDVLSGLFHPRTTASATFPPTTATATTTTTPTPTSATERSTRARGLFHRTRPMRTTRTTTHDQRRTTLAGSPRTVRSTASYASRCPRQSELSSIASHISRYSTEEITNLIRCISNLKSLLTLTTAAPRQGGRTLDADTAKARDMLMLG